jgi:hypothetical protein
MESATILREVATWPPGERLALATQILQTMQPEEKGEGLYPVTEERRKALESLIGIWKTDQVVDEKQIIDEYRMKKYG